MSKYQKLDHKTHVLKRPDTYIGSVRPETNEEWVFSEESIIRKNVTYTPGLLKIFNEILSNSIDNVWRSRDSDTPSTKIKITIDHETGQTTIWNDGLSIPVEIHPKEKIYVPDLVFGHLLTGSNYDDDEQRFSSGRNGVGANVANIFSTEFRVIVHDPVNKKKYQKTWKNNMTSSGKDIVRDISGNKSSVEIIYTPDFGRFGVDGYDDDIISLYYKSAYDAAMSTKLPVFVNGKKIQIKSLQIYSKLFGDKPSIALSSKNCEVVVTSSENNEFEHICYVNGIFNCEGGVHLNSWTEAILRPILDKINKSKKANLTLKDVKRFFRIFVSATIPNPRFSSQMKHRLVAPNVEVDVPTKSITSIMKWDIIKSIREIIDNKELQSLKKVEKTTKAYSKIDGYDPANYSRDTRHKGKWSECCLILCEGLSAKTFATRGITESRGVFGKKGRDWFGIYPLRGKLLNVRNASPTTISNNKEIPELINIIGLKQGVDYTNERNFSTLRYGRIVINTDSDVDGIHISSLILNFISHLFPSILERDLPFVYSMQTPIVKVGNISFYREETFNKYIAHNKPKQKPKYYKGLGTYKNAEIDKEFGKKMLQFIPTTECKSSLDKVFNNKRSNERKKWLTSYDPNKISVIDNSDEISDMTITSFIDNELIKFSISDCERSIPNLFDGLKESQRKILYASFLRKDFEKTEMKVAQFSGFVSEKTCYHHGEQCLNGTIVKMAQNFVGSNNINFLRPDGQFGTRLAGGADAASPRYIFLRREKITRTIFPEDDDFLLKRAMSDGELVEPEFYLPIIPTLLVNGCSSGIGTGWSTSVPMYNPLELVECVRIWLKRQTIFQEDNDGLYSVLPELLPYYRGHTGKMERRDEYRTTSYGNFESNGGNKYTITELPVGVWTDKYKENLEKMLESKTISNLKLKHTADVPKFEITMENPTLEKLKLTNSISTSNMVLFVEDGKLRKFDDVDSIIEYFCGKRYSLYTERKKWKLDKLKKELMEYKNKLRFITEVNDDKIIVFRRKEEDIIKELEDKGYDKSIDEKNYKYLLNIPIHTFTLANITRLEANIERVEKAIKKLKKMTETDMWEEDLANFEKEYKKWIE